MQSHVSVTNFTLAKQKEQQLSAQLKKKLLATKLTGPIGYLLTPTKTLTSHTTTKKLATTSSLKRHTYWPMKLIGTKENSWRACSLKPTKIKLST